VLDVRRPEDHGNGEAEAQPELVAKHGNRVPGVAVVISMHCRHVVPGMCFRCLIVRSMCHLVHLTSLTKNRPLPTVRSIRTRRWGNDSMTWQPLLSHLRGITRASFQSIQGTSGAKVARRFESDRQPQIKDGIIAAAEEVRRDGMALVERIWTEDAPPYLRSPPGGRILRQCWVSQFWVEHGVLRWRHAGDLPPSSVRIDSPYVKGGVERLLKKLSTYKVHVGCVLDPSEACRNTATLSSGRHGLRQRIQLGLGMFRAKRV
jgi:hypothetical protein